DKPAEQPAFGQGSASVVVASAAPPAAPPPAAVGRRDFPEADFTETERSRDPFRPYAKKFAEEAKGRVKSQRQVLLAEFSVVAVSLKEKVTRLEPARAM